MNERLVKGFAINFDPDEPECVFSSKVMEESAFLAKLPELAFVGVPASVLSDVMEKMPGMYEGQPLTVIMSCVNGTGICTWLNSHIQDFEDVLDLLASMDESGVMDDFLDAYEECARLNAAGNC